jgi:hypothetical protein
MAARLPKLEQLSAKALTTLFSDSAVARADAIERALPELGNKHFKLMDNVYRELRGRGIDGQAALLALLDHGSSEVRLNAASLALEFSPSLAEPVLQSLAQLDGLVGYDAAGVLEQWKKGALQFP